jgi:hypothetical protein
VDDAESEEPEFPIVQPEDEPDSSAETLKQYLENLRPEDFGKFNM